jgi:hypothetical protein
VPDPDAPVREDEALRFDCPFCHAKRGLMCVYTSPYGKVGDRYVVGQPTKRAHWQRQEKARWRRSQERYRDTRPVVPATRDQRQAAAALREFDRREYEQLRDWLRAYGEILWSDARPDGSLRGESYSIGHGLDVHEEQRARR